jgi:hypothetical protein
MLNYPRLEIRPDDERWDCRHIRWRGIDVVKGVPGGDFSVCFARNVRTSWDGVAVSLISKDDLIAIKRASGRPQDLLDVESLSESDG